MPLLFHFKETIFKYKESIRYMKKHILLSVLAISMLSLAGCSSTSSLSSKSDTEISALYKN